MVIARLKNKISIPQLIYFLLFFSFLSSKIIIEDDEVWGSVEINKSLPHKIELELEQQFRSDENFQNIYNMFTDVSLEYATHANATLLPRRALVTIDNNHSVFVVDNGKVKKVDISTGFENNEVVEVINGLNGNEEVVTAGHQNLKDSAPVEVVNS